ncbi:DUF6350 family protein [Microbacterium sp. SS28]|uniref:cell division protein PerM n=1 Tax=Microbacterium sp. SS28 TaxID=2919948 RepID=UPI001FAA069E|nr:DUF6350 family protein [Microbacterium sp. SS28]
MHRLIVALLSAFDAAIAVAAGVAAVLAPFTVLWVVALGDTADWGALWPASAAVWQLGHLVPLALSLPGDYLAAAGVSEDAASFALSLAPLAFATFTAIFAARSGARASRADAWLTGVLTGTVVIAALSALIAVSAQNSVATAAVWQAVLFPTLLFAVPALAGAVATEWREAGYGALARLRDRVEAWPGWWGAVPGVSVRASAAAVAGLVGAGALSLAAAIVLRAGDIVALYQAGNFDALGVVVMTLAQFAYLPTLVVWGLSFVAGPGFAVGTDTAVSPSGTQVGVLPGIPAFGLVPESSSPWLLLVVLLPIGVGALAGWIARSHLLAAAGIAPRARARKPARARKVEALSDPASSTPVAPEPDDLDPTDEARRAALEELLARPRATSASAAAADTTARETDAAPAVAAETPDTPSAAPTFAWAPAPLAEPLLPRLVVAVAIALLSAGSAALLAVFASGSIGPGRLAEFGPEPGPVALAVGLQVLVGASILLLSSRSAADREAQGDATAPDAAAAPPVPDAAPASPAESEPPAWATALAAVPASLVDRTKDPLPQPDRPQGSPAFPGPSVAPGPAPSAKPPAAAPSSAPGAPSEPAPSPKVPTTPAPTPPAQTPPVSSPKAPAPGPEPVDPDADTAPIDLP